MAEPPNTQRRARRRERRAERADSSAPRRFSRSSELTVAFPVEGRSGAWSPASAIRIPAGRTLGVVGESGCGKSMTALALMGLVPSPGRVAGSLRFEGRELIGQDETRMAARCAATASPWCSRSR